MNIARLMFISGEWCRGVSFFLLYWTLDQEDMGANTTLWAMQIEKHNRKKWNVTVIK